MHSKLKKIDFEYESWATTYTLTDSIEYKMTSSWELRKVLWRGYLRSVLKDGLDFQEGREAGGT